MKREGKEVGGEKTEKTEERRKGKRKKMNRYQEHDHMMMQSTIKEKRGVTLQRGP